MDTYYVAQKISKKEQERLNRAINYAYQAGKREERERITKLLIPHQGKQITISDFIAIVLSEDWGFDPEVKSTEIKES